MTTPDLLHDALRNKGTAFSNEERDRLGLAVIACGLEHVTDEMYFAAAQALAAQVTDEDLAGGCIFPPAARLRQVAQEVALAVATVGYAQGLARLPRPADLAAHLRAVRYRAAYPAPTGFDRQGAVPAAEAMTA